MFYVRATLAILFGALGLMPMTLAAGCWWLALRLWPGSDRTKVHADEIAALASHWCGRTTRPATPRPAPWPEPPAPAPQAPRSSDQCSPVAAAQIAAIVERTGRTLIRLDGDYAVFGPQADPKMRH